MPLLPADAHAMLLDYIDAAPLRMPLFRRYLCRRRQPMLTPAIAAILLTIVYYYA